MTDLECPKCGGRLAYQQIASSSCERCVECGWLSLGHGHAEVAEMCRTAKADRRPKPLTRETIVEITGAELISGLATHGFIGSAVVPWRCAICERLIFPNEVHKHDAR